MSTPNYNANIVIVEESEINAYYQVGLEFLPNVGDFIELTSLLDEKSGHPSKHRLQVDQITHEITDIDTKSKPQTGGGHFVTIHASPVEVPEVLG
jgi:hypothetical protein